MPDSIVKEPTPQQIAAAQVKAESAREAQIAAAEAKAKKATAQRQQEEDNLSIWREVSKTDPAHTKPVRYGTRQFTSIDAMYQVQRATQLWGPVGKNWGYNVDYSTLAAQLAPKRGEHGEIFKDGGHILLQFADVKIWYFENGKRCEYGPVRGCNLLCNANGSVDEDAPKKAMTDAFTKGLSHLGFSADVFMGLYDDNKYVNRLQQEFGPGKKPIAEGRANGKGKEPEVTGTVPPVLLKMAENLKKLKTVKALKADFEATQDERMKHSDPHRDWIRLQYNIHKDKLLKARPLPPPLPPPPEDQGDDPAEHNDGRFEV